MTGPRLALRRWEGARADAPAVLLVHGMGAHSHWWDTTAPLLADRLSVAAVDLSGHGDSGWRADGAYGDAVFAGDVEAARVELGWERFALVGHSLGARVAIAYAREHGDRLSSLALLDFLTETWPAGRRRDQPVYPSEQEAVRRFRLLPEGTALSQARLEALALHGIKRVEGGWTWKFDWAGLTRSFEPVWPALEALARERPGLCGRTLIARGALSDLMTPGDLDRCLALLPGARGAVIPAAHHHVSLDAPEALARTLLDFAA